MVIYRQDRYTVPSLDKLEEASPNSPTITPTMKGVTIDRIPFFFTNSINNKPEYQKPPLLDIAYINIAHFRNSADEEHGLHFTALPTPYVGLEKDTIDELKKKGYNLSLGSTNFLTLPLEPGRDLPIGFFRILRRRFTKNRKC